MVDDESAVGEVERRPGETVKSHLVLVLAAVGGLLLVENFVGFEIAALVGIGIAIAEVHDAF